MSRALVALLLLAVHAQAVPAQRPQPQAAILPRDITVGDVFHAAIRVEVPAGAQLSAPDVLALPEDLEQTGRREVRFDTVGVPPGSRRATLVYPLTAWRPGAYELAPVQLTLLGDGSDATVTVALPPFEVTSVLPADTAGVAPRPARDVLGANRLWWPILLALLLAALAAAALWYWWRRRRPAVAEPVVESAPAVLPQAAALALLEELRRSGLVERGELKPFYERLTEALRRYAATVRPEWSTDLTTGELAARMPGRGGTAAGELLRILAGADLVKFARAPATAQDAWRDLDAAIAWVRAAEPAVAAPGTDDRRAA